MKQMNKSANMTDSLKPKSSLWESIAVAVLSLGLYLTTLSPTAYPGESASLIVLAAGLDSLTTTLHPIWLLIARSVANLNILTLPLRLNLLSTLTAVISIAIFHRLAYRILLNHIGGKFTDQEAHTPVHLGALLGSLALMFSVPFWSTATQAHYQTFDLLLFLVWCALITQFTLGNKSTWALYLSGLIYGVSIVESTNFLFLLPFSVGITIFCMWRKKYFTFSRFFLVGLCAFIGLLAYIPQAKAYIQTIQGDGVTTTSTVDAILTIWKTQINAIRATAPRIGWIYLFLTSILPWFVTGLVIDQGFNGKKNWSQYTLHLTLTVIAIVALVNAPISPVGVYLSVGKYPVFLYAMIASTVAYLVTYWSLLPKNEHRNVSQRQALFGRYLARLCFWPLATVVCLTVITNFSSARASRGAYVDKFANEILDTLNGRSWFVADGLLDNHLLIQAKCRNIPFNLICLQRDLDPQYIAYLKSHIRKSELFARESDTSRMINTLDLGVLPFVQDWMAFDSEISKKLAISTIPDLWYGINLIPLPAKLFFVGEKDIKSLKDKDILGEYTPFWDRMEAVLAQGERKGEHAPVEFLRAQLRRQMGFVANNLGVICEELDRTADARKIYKRTRTIDPENISALLNQFELVRRGHFQQDKDLIEKELKSFLNGLKHKYPLWSLSRYFGYVRSPELFAGLGHNWAISGQPGAAMIGIEKAIELLPEGQKTFALQTLAGIYSMSNEKIKSANVYKEILKSDPKNRMALVNLTRLALTDGNREEAQKWLALAQKSPSDGKRADLGIEWAALHLISGDIAKARVALQQVVDLQPRNIQAWALLVNVQLLQGEINDVAQITIPKMQNICGTDDNYFIQLSKAQLNVTLFEQLKRELHGKVSLEELTKRCQRYVRPAREAYLRAHYLRPSVRGLMDIVLTYDMAMNDRPAANRHAREVLHVNRKHPLANYVLGSLYLSEGAYGEAEEFLRRAIEDPAQATCEAYNDLAEVLFRLRKLTEAERFARLATEKNPKLHIVWETLACILLENNKLAEADAAIEKCSAIPNDDPRRLITLAAIAHRKGDKDRARMALNQVRSKLNTLSPYYKERIRILSEQIH